MDEMKPVASHSATGEDPNAPMTPEEAIELVRAYGRDVPRPILDKLTPQERSLLIDTYGKQNPGMLNGLMVSPDTAKGIAAAAATIMAPAGFQALGSALKYAPAAARGIPAAVKSGGGMYLGYEGLRGLASLLGLPPGFQNIAGMIGGALGGHMMGGAPAGAMAEEGAVRPSPDVPDTYQGVPVSQIRQAAGPNSVNRTVYNQQHGPFLPEPPGFNMQEPSPSAPPVVSGVPYRATPDEILRQSRELPPNLSLHRSPEDLLENTARGVQLRNSDPAFKPAFRNPGADTPQEMEGSKLLEDLLNATGRERPNPLGQGTIPNGRPSSNPLGKNVSLHRSNADLAETVNRGGVKVEGNTFDPFNQDGSLDESRLERLFAQMDKTRKSKLKSPKK